MDEVFEHRKLCTIRLLHTPDFDKPREMPGVSTAPVLPETQSPSNSNKQPQLSDQSVVRGWAAEESRRAVRPGAGGGPLPRGWTEPARVTADCLCVFVRILAYAACRRRWRRIGWEAGTVAELSSVGVVFCVRCDNLDGRKWDASLKGCACAFLSEFYLSFFTGLNVTASLLKLLLKNR